MVSSSRFILKSILLFAIASAPALGRSGEAFFTTDGQSVVMGMCRQNGLVKVDLASGKITHAALPAEIKEECIESVARGGEGEALFIAKGSVWVWMPDGKAPARRVCSTGSALDASNLFVMNQKDGTLKDALMLTGNSKDTQAYSIGHFFGRKPGAKTAFREVFCRRVGDATAGVFSDEGRFFFVANGDVWEGDFVIEDDSDEGWLATLVGARVAPLAIATTDGANSGSMTTRVVAPVGKWLYVQLSSRHEATLVRVPMPAAPLYTHETQDYPTVQAQLDAMSGSLAKAQILVDGLGDVSGFCASQVDGQPRMFYCTQTEAEGKGPAMFLWEGKGEPRIIGYLPLPAE